MITDDVGDVLLRKKLIVNDHLAMQRDHLKKYVNFIHHRPCYDNRPGDRSVGPK